MNPMRLAITGASGLLGREILQQACDRFDVVAAVHSDELSIPGRFERVSLDLGDESSVRAFIAQSQPDIIIHTAALTNVDMCEEQPATAQRINADGTKRLAAAIDSIDCRMIYVSTDYVFDGSSGPYSESDSTHPVNVYGKTKLEGEHAVLGLGSRAAIVRSASFLGFGGETRPTFAERMVQEISLRDSFPAADDQISNVTPIQDLAAGLLRVLDAGVSGIWHIASPELLSRYDLALLIAKLLNIDSRRISRVPYQSLGRPAQRPLRGGLKVDKAINELGCTFRPVSECLKVLISSTAH